MKGQNILVILLLVIAGAAIFLFTAGVFSIVDDGGLETGPSCLIPEQGGSCDLVLTLPQDVKLSEGYSFDLVTKPTYDAEFKDEQILTLITTGGPFISTGSLSYYSEEFHTLRFYDAPQKSNLYQWKVVATSDATCRTTSSTSSSYSSSRAEAELGVGQSSKPTLIPVDVCLTKIDDQCSGEDNNAYVQTWTENGYKEYAYNYIAISSKTYIACKPDSSSYPYSQSTTLIAETISENNATNIVVETNKDIRQYTSGTATFTEPIVKYSWKEQYDITDLKVNVAGQEFKNYPGKITERIYLPSMTDEINKYCDRNGLFPEDKECVLKITFESSRGGQIVLASELGELVPIKSQGDFDFGSVTGLVSFDYSGEPVKAGISTGVIALILGIIIFFIVRGGKK